MNHPSLSVTTHTVELTQLAELNHRLRSRESRFTASDLGLGGAHLRSRDRGEGLPGSALLTRLDWDGPPNYPYVHANFEIPGKGSSQVIDLHTAALRELATLLGVRQQWGA